MELSAAEQARWVLLFGTNIPIPPDLTLLELERDSYGRVLLDSAARRCLYVVVDHDDHVVYVGMCRRDTSSVRSRFREHHAVDDSWSRVWVVPVHDTVGRRELLDMESALIGHFDPPCNTRGRRTR